MLQPAVRKPASTETAVRSSRGEGVDSVLRADPRALPAHAAVLPLAEGEVKLCIALPEAMSAGASCLPFPLLAPSTGAEASDAEGEERHRGGFGRRYRKVE